jgi:hypothetical protein
MAALAVTEARKEVVEFSMPFMTDMRKNESYAFAFPKGSKWTKKFSEM